MFIGLNRGLGGGFAPYCAAHQSQLYKVPPAVSSQAAVLTEPLAVALQTLYDNPPRNSDKILVLGGGVIGNLIVQASRVLAPECRISVVEPSPYAAQMVHRHGADDLIPTKDIFPYSAQITGARNYKPLLGMEIPMGGFDRVYDTVASATTLNLALRLLTTMGTLSIVGIGGDVKLDLTPLWLKLQTVKGVYAYGVVDHHGTKRHVFEIALELLAQNRIDAAVLVTHKFELKDYKTMLAVNFNKAKYQALKTVVAFEPDRERMP
jgi:threonine dehydrogenase-like Zn-dependent dehydrogenase